MIHGNVKRWGNSPAIRIPATLMQALNPNIDDEIKIDLVEGKLIIEPVKQEVAYSLAELPEEQSVRARDGELSPQGCGIPLRSGRSFLHDAPAHRLPTPHLQIRPIKPHHFTHHQQRRRHRLIPRHRLR